MGKKKQIKETEALILELSVEFQMLGYSMEREREGGGTPYLVFLAGVKYW